MLSASLSTPSLDLSRAPAGRGTRVFMHNPDESYIVQHEEKLAQMGMSARETLMQTTQSIGDHLSSIMNTAFLQLRADIANRKMYVMFEELLHCDIRTDHTQARSVLPIFEQFIEKAEQYLQSSFYYFVKREVEYCVVDCISKHIQEHESDISKIFDLTLAFTQSQLMNNVTELAKNSVIDAKLIEKTHFLSEIVRLKEMLFQKQKIGDMYLAETEWSKRLLLKLMRSDYVEYGQTLKLKDILLRGSEKKQEIEAAIANIELQKAAQISKKRLEMLSGNDSFSGSDDEGRLGTTGGVDDDLDIRQTRGQLLDKLQHKNAYIAQLEETLKTFKLLQKDFADKVKELNIANERVFRLNYKKEELEKYIYKLSGVDMRSPERRRSAPYRDEDLEEVSKSAEFNSLLSTMGRNDSVDEADSRKPSTFAPSGTLSKRSVFEPKDLLIEKLNEDIKALEKLLSGDNEKVYAELRRYRTNEFQHRRKILTYKRFLEFDHGKRGRDHPITGFEPKATPLAIDKQIDMLYWIRKALLKTFGIKIKDADSEKTILKRLNETIAYNYVNPEPSEFNSSFNSEGSIDWEGDIAAEKRLQLNSVFDDSTLVKDGSTPGAGSTRTPGRGWMPNLNQLSNKSGSRKNSTLADLSQPLLNDTPIRFHQNAIDRSSDFKGGYYDEFGNFLGTDIFCPHCGKYVDETAIVYSNTEMDTMDPHRNSKIYDDSAGKHSSQGDAASVTPLGSVKRRGSKGNASQNKRIESIFSNKTPGYKERTARHTSPYNAPSKHYVLDPSLHSLSPAVSMRVRFGDQLTSRVSCDPMTIPELKASQPLMTSVIAPDIKSLHSQLKGAEKQRFEHVLFKQNIIKRGNPSLCAEIERELTPALVSSITPAEVDKILAVPCDTTGTAPQLVYDSSLDDSFVNYIDESENCLKDLQFSDASDPDLFQYLYKSHAKDIADAITAADDDIQSNTTVATATATGAAHSPITTDSLPTNQQPDLRDSVASDGFVAISGNVYHRVTYNTAELFDNLLLHRDFQHFVNDQALDPRVISTDDVKAYIACKKVADLPAFYKTVLKDADDEKLAAFAALPEFSPHEPLVDVSITADEFEIEMAPQDSNNATESYVFVSKKQELGIKGPSHIFQPLSRSQTVLGTAPQGSQKLSRPQIHCDQVQKRNLCTEEVFLDPLSSRHESIDRQRPTSSPCMGHVTVNGVDVRLRVLGDRDLGVQDLEVHTLDEIRMHSRDVLKRHLPDFYHDENLSGQSLTPRSHSCADARSPFKDFMHGIQIRPLCKRRVRVISNERAELLKDPLENDIRAFKRDRAVKLFLQERTIKKILELKRELKRSRTRHRLMREKRHVLAAKKALFIKYINNRGSDTLVSSLDILEEYAATTSGKVSYVPMPVVASSAGDWIVNSNIASVVNTGTAGTSSNEAMTKSNEFGYLQLSAVKTPQTADSTEHVPLPLESVTDFCEDNAVGKDEVLGTELRDLEQTSALAQQLLEKIKLEISKAINVINKGVQVPQGLIDEDAVDIYAPERAMQRTNLAVEITNRLFKNSDIANKNTFFMNLPIKAAEMHNVDDVFQRLYDEAAAINERLNNKRLQYMQDLTQTYTKLHSMITRPSEVTEFLRIGYYGADIPVSRYNYHHAGMFTSALNKKMHGLAISKRPLNGGLTAGEIKLLEETNIVKNPIQLNEKTANIINVIFGKLQRSKSAGSCATLGNQPKSLMMGPGQFVSWQDASAELQELIEINNKYSSGVRGYHSMAPGTAENLGTIGRSAFTFPQNLTRQQLEEINAYGEGGNEQEELEAIIDGESQEPPPLPCGQSSTPMNSSLINEQNAQRCKSASTGGQESLSSIAVLPGQLEKENASLETQTHTDDTAAVPSSSLFNASTALLPTIEEQSVSECPTLLPNSVVSYTGTETPITSRRPEVQKTIVHQKLELTLDARPASRPQQLSSRKVLQALHSQSRNAQSRHNELDSSQERVTDRHKDIAGMKFTISTIKLDPITPAKATSRPTPSAVSQRSAISHSTSHAALRTNSSYQTPLPSLATGTTMQDATYTSAVTPHMDAPQCRSLSSITSPSVVDDLIQLKPLKQLSRSNRAAGNQLDVADLQSLPQLSHENLRLDSVARASSDLSRASHCTSGDYSSTVERVDLGDLV